MAEMITTDAQPQTQKPSENIIPKCEEECEEEEECDEEEEECDEEEEEECDEEDEEECDEEDEEDEEEYDEEEEEDYEFKDIYFVILQNKPDYNNDFPNKAIWNKNMKAYVYTYLQNNPLVSYKELIKVPKYIIDAPFETPSETTADYNEEDFDIITEDVDTDDGDDADESEPGQEGVSDDNYYIIRIHKITILVNEDNDIDLEKLRCDRQAYEDFEAGDELGDNIRDGVSCIASTCTKIVLVTYVLAFFVGIMPLVLSEKNNINNQHQQWCSDHMYCSKY